MRGIIQDRGDISQQIKIQIHQREKNMDEKDLQNKLEGFLSRFFHVGHEVCSCPPHERRIDIMLVHKSDIDKNFPIGIEVKVAEKKTGTDLANWIKQAYDYSKITWKDYGRVLMVTYPQISELYLREGERMQKHVNNGAAGQGHNVATFLSQFGIGELQKYRDRNGSEMCRIVYKGQRIWDMKDDKLRINNYKALVK